MNKEGNPGKFYITTPIYYVNARPHIGHTLGIPIRRWFATPLHDVSGCLA